MRHEAEEKADPESASLRAGSRLARDGNVAGRRWEKEKSRFLTRQRQRVRNDKFVFCAGGFEIAAFGTRNGVKKKQEGTIYRAPTQERTRKGALDGDGPSVKALGVNGEDGANGIWN